MLIKSKITDFLLVRGHRVQTYLCRGLQTEASDKTNVKIFHSLFVVWLKFPLFVSLLSVSSGSVEACQHIPL